MHCRRSGQALPLLALILPVLVLFVMVVIELANLWLAVAVMEDALQQATRSAVQQIEYAALARNGQALRGNRTCQAVTIHAPSQCADIVKVAHQFLLVNMQATQLTGIDPAALSATARWTVLPQGGACAGVASATPLLCAELQPTMRGLFGLGEVRPRIRAADTIDRLGQP
ncbi:TadE/TadG family type IV pilus assembly protein [Chloroflexus sp.]|uniref:TadE/TadG family type IV pilus assembly protein n=1 Tax=Chloroflexus sp. TaxID=1904827 RepID=UPI002ACE45A0|nr:TadE/TadG family type IV pilus assembly protein [Chloroflexus sp.]